tara:strand:+ start:739 stop:912 length:174 start_codon:yes stop_codon:yes gene_type:complete
LKTQIDELLRGAEEQVFGDVASERIPVIPSHRRGNGEAIAHSLSHMEERDGGRNDGR